MIIKEKDEKSFRIVKKLALKETLMTLPVGQEISMKTADFTSWASLVSTVCRINKAAQADGKPDVFRLTGRKNFTEFTLSRLSE